MILLPQGQHMRGNVDFTWHVMRHRGHYVYSCRNLHNTTIIPSTAASTAAAGAHPTHTHCRSRRRRRAVKGRRWEGERRREEEGEREEREERKQQQRIVKEIIRREPHTLEGTVHCITTGRYSKTPPTAGATQIPASSYSNSSSYSYPYDYYLVRPTHHFHLHCWPQSYHVIIGICNAVSLRGPEQQSQIVQPQPKPSEDCITTLRASFFFTIHPNQHNAEVILCEADSQLSQSSLNSVFEFTELSHPFQNRE